MKANNSMEMIYCWPKINLVHGSIKSNFCHFEFWILKADKHETCLQGIFTEYQHHDFFASKKNPQIPSFFFQHTQQRMQIRLCPETLGLVWGRPSEAAVHCPGCASSQAPVVNTGGTFGPLPLSLSAVLGLQLTHYDRVSRQRVPGLIFNARKMLRGDFRSDPHTRWGSSAWNIGV